MHVFWERTTPAGNITVLPVARRRVWHKTPFLATVSNISGSGEEPNETFLTNSLMLRDWRKGGVGGAGGRWMNMIGGLVGRAGLTGTAPGSVRVGGG